MITYLRYGISRDKFCALLTVKILRIHKIVLACIAVIEFNLFSGNAVALEWNLLSNCNNLLIIHTIILREMKYIYFLGIIVIYLDKKNNTLS